VIEPDAGRTARYAEKLRLFRRLYDDLNSAFHAGDNDRF
jgi:hypothetical protein